MKKIRKMLGSEKEPRGSKENVSEQNANGVQSTKKKVGFYKGLKGIAKYLYPKKSDATSANAETKGEEITVEKIQENILQKRFWKASQGLTVLEREVYSQIGDKLHEDRKQELESLYEELDKEVFKAVKDSIVEEDEDLLTQAIRAIMEQEAEDNIYSEDHDTSVKPNPARPRKWKQKWGQYVKLSVIERIQKLPAISPNDPDSSISQNFINLGKTIKTDLIHVVKHLKPHYPEEFDVCDTYVRHYHSILKSQVEIITEFQLDGKDSYFILCWVHNIYPTNVLKDSALLGHIEETKLESLLAAHKIRELEGSYLPYEVGSVKEWMSNSLNLEVQRWKEGNEPVKLGAFYHSELHIDVIQSYNGAIKRAAQLSPRMSHHMASRLASVLVEFLKSYMTSFEEFKEKHKTDEYFRAIVIANINCCRTFRDFVARNDNELQPRSKETMNSILNEFEELGFDILLHDLFQELKVYFKKISQGNGLCSHQVMSDIIKVVEKHTFPLKTLTPSCYKDAIDRIHFHLVKEYVTRLLKKKVSHKNVRQLQTLANQVHENANLISDFFSCHESQATWLNPLIPKLAEIIRLQDVNAIQLEVAALAEDYPDIGKKHVEAVLYIKGNLSRNEGKSILGVLNSFERRDNTTPQFFSLIKPS
ncbi:tumor necrosis factor alpha-induced protein 2-like [Spea bombifrons]|uniref:tumor necrosis factor alpha-induced protein 2-like n=1 Tax=Spea bombifrons TaxID=233779 RepID=UPI00234BEDF0|nr:tumor necrosis factor alpha-induced protein 2-like [Spea bombifrons]XP_053331446.1 tumor necrosis factor alpha-induced protein 2-like [Spea bombifrons]